MPLVLPRRKAPEPIPEPVSEHIPAPIPAPIPEPISEPIPEPIDDEQEQEQQESQLTDSLSNLNESLSPEAVGRIMDEHDANKTSLPPKPSLGKKRKASSAHEVNPEPRTWVPVLGAPIHTQNKPIGPNAVAAFAMGARAHRYDWQSNTQESEDYYATGMPADPARNKKQKRRTLMQRKLDEWRHTAAISKKANAKEAAKAEIEALEETHRVAVSAVYEKHGMQKRVEKPKKRPSRASTKTPKTPPRQQQTVIDLTGSDPQPVQKQQPQPATMQRPVSSSAGQTVPPTFQQAPHPFVQPGEYQYLPQWPYQLALPVFWQGPYQAAPPQFGVAPTQHFAPAPVAATDYQGPPRTLAELRARQLQQQQQQQLQMQLEPTPQVSQGTPQASPPQEGPLFNGMTADEEWALMGPLMGDNSDPMISAKEGSMFDL